jgi:hypothetical protein
MEKEIPCGIVRIQKNLAQLEPRYVTTRIEYFVVVIFKLLQLENGLLRRYCVRCRCRCKTILQPKNYMIRDNLLCLYGNRHLDFATQTTLLSQG